jgi:Sulfotransferase family
MIDPQSGMLYIPNWASSIQSYDKRVLSYRQIEQSLSLPNMSATNSSQPEAQTIVAAKYKADFNGIVPRAFEAWPENQTLPCFPLDTSVVLRLSKNRERDKITFNSTQTNNADVDAQQGFFFLKPFKVGSSTAAGVNLRIARGVAMRKRRELHPQSLMQQHDGTLQQHQDHQQEDEEQPIQPHEFCNARFDHGDWQRPGLRFAKRNRQEKQSFLWTVVREPTARLVSMFFHFHVSRRRLEPRDEVFQGFLQDKRQLHPDYYIRTLDTSEDIITIYKNNTKTNTTTSFSKVVQKKPVETANFITKDYDFIGVTERFDESLVALMMILHLPMSDILYLSAKRKGGYDAAGKGIGTNRTCTYITPSFVSPGMREYFASNVHQEMIQNDLAFYRAVNQSLDMTIDKLGRIAFETNLAQYRMASVLIQQRCMDNVVMPCTETGDFVEHNQTDCLWKDSGCATSCLDKVAEELDIV